MQQNPQRDSDPSSNPFTPHQPVTHDLFTGRDEHVEWITRRGFRSVKAGGTSCFFIEGDYGIGKTSLAQYLMEVGGSPEHTLLGIPITLGTSNSIAHFSEALFEGTLISGALDPRRSESARNWIADLVGKQTIVGTSIDISFMKKNFPALESHGSALIFLREVFERVRADGFTGLFLTLDEIDGLSDSDIKTLANLLKNMVDVNSKPEFRIPMVIVVCGLPSTRGRLISAHPSTARLFDVRELTRLPHSKVQEFLRKALQQERKAITVDALHRITPFIDGSPKLMQIIGYEVWDVAIEQKGKRTVDLESASAALIAASDLYGRKEVAPRLNAMRVDEHREIIKRLGGLPLGLVEFSRKDARAVLNESQLGKFSYVMKALQKEGLIHEGRIKGTYVFSDNIFRFHLRVEEERRKLQLRA